MARTTDYKLKGEKIKGQIDELVTALIEEKKNNFDENRKVKIANIDLEELIISSCSNCKFEFQRFWSKEQNSPICRIIKV